MSWERTGEYAHGHEISVLLLPADNPVKYHWQKGYERYEAHCNNHSYEARTREAVIRKAQRDPRNDPRSLHRNTGPLTEVRTVLSRTKTALRSRYWDDRADFEAPEMREALTKVVELLERWQKP